MAEIMLGPADAAVAVQPDSVEARRTLGSRIEAAEVSRRASGRQLLHDVSFSVEPGELVALAGGSGAGKTTLLEILAGLQSPSAGHVTHDGVRVELVAVAPEQDQVTR